MSKKKKRGQKGIVEKKQEVLYETPELKVIEEKKIVCLIDRIHLVYLFEKLMNRGFIPNEPITEEFMDKHFEFIEDY